MKKVKFVIRVFDRISHDFIYLKTRSGLSTKFKKDAFEFESIEDAELCVNKLGLFDDDDLLINIFLKYGDDLWQKART